MILSLMSQKHLRHIEVTGDPRPALEGKWVISGGIEILCKYRLYGPKNVKKEVRAAIK